VSIKSQKSADNGGYANPSTRFYTPPICEILTLGDGDTIPVGNEQFRKKSYVDPANGPISETPEEDFIEGQQMIVESKAKTPAKDAKLTVESLPENFQCAPSPVEDFVDIKFVGDQDWAPKVAEDSIRGADQGVISEKPGQEPSNAKTLLMTELLHNVSAQKTICQTSVPF
jgi:hypothetical protein